MQNPRELKDVVSPTPLDSFQKFIRKPMLVTEEEINDGTELDLELSLGVGPKRVRPAILRSSSEAVSGKEALSMKEGSNSTPVKSHQRGEMDPNPNPALIPAWARADQNLGIAQKVGGPSETNILATRSHGAGMNVTGVIPSDGNRKRGRGAEEWTETRQKQMPIVYSNGVEGRLYKYTSTHNVIIVCSCHGKFHTPAEFVMHAGGGDVPNPLKCVTVSKVNAAQLRSTWRGQNAAA